MIETAIIILNWKLPELTLKTIHSIKQNTDCSKIALILIDQEVSEPYKESVCQYTYSSFGQIVLISNKENVGVPKGYNQGIQEALKINLKYIVLMNNDVEVLPGWLDEFKRCAESNPEIGIVGGKALKYGEDPKHPDHFGMIVFRDGCIIGKQIFLEPGTPDLNLDVETYAVGFACALIKTEVFKDTGLFDENYSPCDYEDTDLCFNARSKGWKVVSCIPAKYYHLQGATFKQNKLELGAVFDRNQKYFAEKWKDML